MTRTAAPSGHGSKALAPSARSVVRALLLAVLLCGAAASQAAPPAAPDPLAGTGLQLQDVPTEGQAMRYRLQGPGAPGLILDGPPWPAPGGRLLVVATLAQDGQAGGVLLLGRVGTAWRLLYRFEAVGRLGFVFRGWRSDAVSARLDAVCGSGAPTVIHLRDGPYGWDLTPPPAACP